MRRTIKLQRKKLRTPTYSLPITPLDKHNNECNTSFHGHMNVPLQLKVCGTYLKFAPKIDFGATCYKNHLFEAVPTSTHNLCFELK